MRGENSLNFTVLPGGKTVTGSFGTGTQIHARSLMDEARRYPEVVISRLMKKGDWVTASQLLDRFIRISSDLSN